MASWRQAADAIRSVVEAALITPAFPPSKTFVGWPDPNTILADLRGPTPGVIINIYAHAGSTSTARYHLSPPDVFKFDATETITINGLTATLDGTVTLGDNTFLYINNVHGFGAHSKVDSTSVSLAQDLVNLINASPWGYGASASGPNVTVFANPTSITTIGGRTFGQGQVMTEVGRITRRMQLSIWAAHPDTRANIEDKIIELLSLQEFLQYADGSLGRIAFESSTTHDTAMVANIFKSDIFYSVEYGVYSVDFAARVGDVMVDLVNFTLIGTPQTGLTVEVF